MYHVELRQFPHNFCRFNLTEDELHEAVLDSWAQGAWIEFGERKWNPHQAQLTVLEGPQLPLEQLSMGRGWRTAVRQGQNVTERLLAAARAEDGLSGEMDGPNSVGSRARQKVVGGEGALDMPAPVAALSDLSLLADSLGLEVLAKLSDGPAPVAIVWRFARERYPAWTASDSLKLAEHAVRSLTRSRLIVVLVGGEGGELEPCSSDEQLDAALRLIDSWSIVVDSASVLIRRA